MAFPLLDSLRRRRVLWLGIALLVVCLQTLAVAHGTDHLFHAGDVTCATAAAVMPQGAALPVAFEPLIARRVAEAGNQKLADSRPAAASPVYHSRAPPRA